MKQTKWMLTVGHVGGCLGIVLGLFLVFYDIISWYWLLPWPIIHIWNTIVITSGLHRYFCHASYKTTRFWHNVFAYYSVVLLYGSPYAWSVIHTTHHVYSDTSRDSHYATWKYLFTKQFKDVPMLKHRLKHLVGDPTLNIVHRYGMLLWVIFVVAFLLVSPIAFLYLYVMPLGSAHLVGAIHQLTSHYGKQPRNLAILEYVLPISGEWIHKNHHDKWNTPSFRSKWWHLDIGAGFINLIKTDKP